MVSRITYNSSYIDDNGFAVVKYDNILNIFFYDATKDKWADPTNDDYSFTGYGQDGNHYTAGVQDGGPVEASWKTEVSSATRGSGTGATNPKPDFPDHAIIVVSSPNRQGEITSGSFSDTAWDIIDADTNRHWMRFENADEAVASTDRMLIRGAQALTSFSSSTGRGSILKMYNGTLVLGMNGNNGWGWVACSFVKDKAMYTQNGERWDWDSTIEDRNGGGSGGWTSFETVVHTGVGQGVGGGLDIVELVGDGKEYIAIGGVNGLWLVRNTFDCEWSSVEGFQQYYVNASTDDFWYVSLLPSGKLYGWSASRADINVWYDVWQDPDNSVNNIADIIYTQGSPSTSAGIGGDTSDQCQGFFVTDHTSVLEPSSSTIFLALMEQGVQVMSLYEKDSQESLAKSSWILNQTIFPPVGYSAHDDTINNVGDIYGRGSPVNNFPQIQQQTWIVNPMRRLGNLGTSELEFYQVTGAQPGVRFGVVSNSVSSTNPFSSQMLHEHIHNNNADLVPFKNVPGNQIGDINGINRSSNPVIFLRLRRGGSSARYFTLMMCMSPFSTATPGTLGENYMNGYCWIDGPGGGSMPSMSRLYRLDGGGVTPVPVQIDGEAESSHIGTSFWEQFYIQLKSDTIKVYDVTNQEIGPGASNNFTNDIPFLTATDTTYDGGQMHVGVAHNDDETTASFWRINEITITPPQPVYSISGGSHRVIYVSGDEFASRDTGRLVIATTGNFDNEPTIASEAHYQVIDLGLKYNSPNLHPTKGVQLFHVSSEDDQVPDITSEWIYPAAAGPTG